MRHITYYSGFNASCMNGLHNVWTCYVLSQYPLLLQTTQLRAGARAWNNDNRWCVQNGQRGGAAQVRAVDVDSIPGAHTPLGACKMHINSALHSFYIVNLRADSGSCEFLPAQDNRRETAVTRGKKLHWRKSLASMGHDIILFRPAQGQYCARLA